MKGFLIGAFVLIYIVLGGYQLGQSSVWLWQNTHFSIGEAK